MLSFSIISFFYYFFSFTDTLVCSLGDKVVVTRATMPREQQREAQSSDLLSAFDFRWEKGRRSGALQEIELGGCSRINDVWIEDRRKKEKKKKR